MSSGRLFWEL